MTRSTFFSHAVFATLLFGMGVGSSAAQPASAKVKTKAISVAKLSKPSKTTISTKPIKPIAKPATAIGVSGSIGAVAPLPRVYAPTKPRETAPRYPWRKEVVTTVFWIGEVPTAGNPTPNHASSWDMQWQLNYGGFDSPDRDARTPDFRPKAFTPGLNPFYVALPFNDITNPEIARRIPWYRERKAKGAKSVCQSVWLAIRLGNKTCFAQWEDCGPFTTDDHGYVFEGKPPKTSGNGGAGLDVSPAVRDYLGITSGAATDWRFCNEHEVPDGPWKWYGKNNSFLSSAKRNDKDLQQRYQELVKKREEWLRMQTLRKIQGN